MKKNIAISLLTHNDITYLSPCIESLLKSDIMEHNVKLFSIDNNSTDGTRNYLESIPLEKTLVYNDKNEGIVIPRIKLYEEIKKGNYDFLLELHADMVFPSKWINELFAIDADNVGILQPHIITPNERPFSVEKLEDYIEKNKNTTIHTKCRQVHPWLVKLSVLDKIGGYYDPNFSPHECEDDDLIYRVLKNKFRVKTIGTSYVVHYGGVTRHILPSCLSQHQQYFYQKHGVTTYQLAAATEIHPAHQI